MKNKGFTLIELLAVIVILGIIITITSTNVIKSVQKARLKATMIDLTKKINEYNNENTLNQNISNTTKKISEIDSFSDKTYNYKGYLTLKDNKVNSGVICSDQNGKNYSMIYENSNVEIFNKIDLCTTVNNFENLGISLENIIKDNTKGEPGIYIYEDVDKSNALYFKNKIKVKFNDKYWNILKIKDNDLMLISEDKIDKVSPENLEAELDEYYDNLKDDEKNKIIKKNWTYEISTVDDKTYSSSLSGYNFTSYIGIATLSEILKSNVIVYEKSDSWETKIDTNIINLDAYTLSYLSGNNGLILLDNNITPSTDEKCVYPAVYLNTKDYKLVKENENDYYSIMERSTNEKE